MPLQAQFAAGLAFGRVYCCCSDGLAGSSDGGGARTDGLKIYQGVHVMLAWALQLTRGAV